MTNCLLLIPTAFELQHLPNHFLQAVERNGAAIELCGFGPVVAAARAASLIASYRPKQVVLCGIAGALDDSLDVGSAYCFDEVACYGIGVGDGQSFRTASMMGWRQWPGNNSSSTQDDSEGLSASIEDVITLRSKHDSPDESKQLLTSCAASQSKFDVELKRKLFPKALAEDMEGFAVAAACQLAGVPLGIVRGISNCAGDRTHSQWKIAEAMMAAAKLVEEMEAI